MISAGHETTAHALTFLIAFIIADSEVQDKMHAEIIQTDGSKFRFPLCIPCL